MGYFSSRRAQSTRARLLVVGCGDIGMRAVKLLSDRYRVFALTRERERFAELQSAGIVPVLGNLDEPRSLFRLAGIADAVLHFAPPQTVGQKDLRTRNLLAALSQTSILPRRLVYISTSGVYGDRRGAWTAETTPTAPQSERAIRRCNAETQLREWAVRNQVALAILRAPGIYSEQRLPIERLRKSTPALRSEDDSFSNHIHAADLAAAAVQALHFGRPGRVYNVCDDSPAKMGDYFDLVADAHQLPRPPRIDLVTAAATLPRSLFSFMRESRRLHNTRLKKELGLELCFPSVAAFLQVLIKTGKKKPGSTPG